MGSNSLRGGKNIYGERTLMANWFEERLEPGNIDKSKEGSGMLAPKTEKTWSKTSDAHGNEFKETMKRAVTSTATDNWLNYQKVESNDMYKTTAGSVHCEPNDQTPAFNAPYIPEEKLVDYRERWTGNDAERFKRATY